MTTYTEILDTQLDPDAPITSALGYQLRDNPVALSEGAEDAPKISPTALGSLFLGFIQVPTDSNYVEITDLDRVKTIIMHGAYLAPSAVSNRAFQISYSDDNGSSWETEQDFFTPNQDIDGFIAIHFDLETGAVDVSASRDGGNRTVETSTLTVPSDVNAIRIRNEAVGGAIDAVAVAIGGVSP